ncbi:MAG: hypothetical protein Fur0014_16930 [Rubrivivax sp.]
MSYGIARRMAKNPDEFDRGPHRGRGRARDAAHAAGTSALLPMLTLGIPGSPAAAVPLGGLLIFGVLGYLFKKLTYPLALVMLAWPLLGTITAMLRGTAVCKGAAR